MSRHFTTASSGYLPQHVYCFTAEVFSVEEKHIFVMDVTDVGSDSSKSIQISKSQCNAAIHDIRSGDRVSVRHQSGEYIIEFRFQRESEDFLPFEYDVDGRLCLLAGKSLLLQTQKGLVSISEKGEVSIKGTDLEQDFTQHYRVMCPSISFN